MLARLSTRKHVKTPATQRNAILRGVYDQNRGLRAETRPAPRRRWIPGKSVLALVALVTVVTGMQLLHASGQPGEALLALITSASVKGQDPVAEQAVEAVLVEVADRATPSSRVQAAAHVSMEGATAPAAGPGATPAVLAATSEPPGGAAPPLALPSAAAASQAGAEKPAPFALAPVEIPTGKPVELADVVPALAEQENIKHLFGLSVKTVVIDAGHGGHDPGAIGKSGLREKDVTLDVARRLKEKLKANEGFRVVLVRDEDNFVPLRERAGFANSHDTDLFVSIHVNYLPSTSTNAVETYYFGRHQDARTRKLAERENQGSGYSLSEFENVVRNVQDTIKLQESQALAHSIQGNLLRSIRAQNKRVLDNGVRTAPFVVLLGVKAPSVLVEIGSLSSPEAEQSLRSEAYRDEIASYVAAGISDYLNRPLPQEREIHEQDKSRLAERQ